MSEASKKRLPLHKHLSYQIIEASKEEFSPRERGVHATDVLVDSMISLAETLTSFTRLWEAEVAEEIASWAETVTDAGASNEKAVKVPITNVSTGDILAFVKSKNLNLVGNLYYVVRLKVSDNTPTSDIAKIQVYDEAGAAVLAEWIIAPNDFPNANEYHHFACLFELPKDKTQITLKVILITAGLADLWIDYGGLIPKTMPIAYADVTVLTRDPGTDAGITNPGTDAAPNSTGLTVDDKDPLTDAASNTTGLDVDEEDPLTDAIIADGMHYNQIFSDARTSVTIGTSETTIIQIPCSTFANPIPFTVVEIWFSGFDGSAQLWFALYWSPDGTSWYKRGAQSHYVNATNFPRIHVFLAIPVNFVGGYVKLTACCSVTRIVNHVVLEGWQFQKHDHSITNDAHLHGTTEPIGGHDHAISGDSHYHDTTEYDHDHSVTGDSHDHTISGDSHDHSDDTLGHQH